MVKSLFQCMVILSDPYTADYRVFSLPLLEAWIEASKLMGFSTTLCSSRKLTFPPGVLSFCRHFLRGLSISPRWIFYQAVPCDSYLYPCCQCVFCPQVRQTQILKKLVLSLKGANKMAGAAWKHGGGRRLTNSIHQPSLCCAPPSPPELLIVNESGLRWKALDQKMLGLRKVMSWVECGKATVSENSRGNSSNSQPARDHGKVDKVS